MQLSIYVIPGAEHHLTQTQKMDNGLSKFKVTDSKGNVFPNEITLPLHRDREQQLIIDIWQLTNALRTANIINTEATLVSSIHYGFYYANVGGQKLDNMASRFVYGSGMPID